MSNLNRAEKCERIQKHCENLLSIFPDCQTDRWNELFVALRKLEKRGAALALQQCNGPALSEEDCDRRSRSILRRLNALLQPVKKTVPILLNGDPRGYALKIESKYVREHGLTIERDWGGYGIIAPEF